LNSRAKTRDILKAYQKAKMPGVIQYLLREDLDFEKDTWAEKAQQLALNNQWGSLEEEINLIVYKFNL
jgi:hypothetical protein